MRNTISTQVFTGNFHVPFHSSAQEEHGNFHVLFSDRAKEHGNFRKFSRGENTITNVINQNVKQGVTKGFRRKNVK